MDVLSYPVLTNPEPAVVRWRMFRSRAISRAVSIGVSLLIWGAIWYFTRDALWPGFWWFFGFSVGLSSVLLVWALTFTFMAKRELRALHEGLALGLGQDGIFLDGPVPWEAIRAFVVKPGRFQGSAKLVVVSKAGTWRTLPLQWLDRTPSGLDNAVRALSGNRLAIDLDPIDRNVPVVQQWRFAASDGARFWA